MMENIYFRPALIEDLPILYDFEQGIIEAERPYNETLKPGHISYYDITGMIEATDTEVIVGVCGEELIASVYVSIKAAKPYLKHDYFAYLGFMYVKPAYRGRGINRKIIEETKNWASKKGIKEVRLDVYEDNYSAVRAYEKAGFKKHLVNMRIEI